MHGRGVYVEGVAEEGEREHDEDHGGAGRDDYQLYVPNDDGADVITDFEAGLGGDILRIDA